MDKKIVNKFKINDQYFMFKYLIVIGGSFTHCFYALTSYIMGDDTFVGRLICISCAFIALKLYKHTKYKFSLIFSVLVVNLLFLLNFSYLTPVTNSGIVIVMIFMTIVPMKFTQYLCAISFTFVLFLCNVYILIQNHGEFVIKESISTLGAFIAIFVVYLCINKYRQLLEEADKSLVDVNLKLKVKNENLKSTYNQLVHDVKSPLTALKFLSNKEDEASSLLKTATDRVEKIILDLERGNSGEAAFEKYNLFLTVNNIVEEAKIKYANILSEVSINFECDSELDSLIELPISEIVLSRIVSNLINNAFEAKSSGKLIINVKAFKKKNNLEFIVKDNGSGVSVDQLGLILNKGYSTKGKSRGLGLSYVKDEVEKVGGELKVSSNNGFQVQILIY